jgi:hypothetical protein
MTTHNSFRKLAVSMLAGLVLAAMPTATAAARIADDKAIASRGQDTERPRGQDTERPRGEDSERPRGRQDGTAR